VRGAAKDAATAVEMSKDMVMKQFDTVQAGDRTNVLIHKNSYGSASSGDVKAWLDWNSQPKGLGSLDVRVPEKDVQKFVAAYGDTPESRQRAKDNYVSVISRDSRWITNPAQDGVYLVQDNGIDSPAPLFNSTGKLVEMKYKDMREHDAEEAKEKATSAAIKSSKGITGFFGGF